MQQTDVDFDVCWYIVTSSKLAWLYYNTAHIDSQEISDDDVECKSTDTQY